MGEYAPFRYKCDGCDRTIGDIGAFLWKFKDDECYCPKCWKKLEDNKNVLLVNRGNPLYDIWEDDDLEDKDGAEP